MAKTEPVLCRKCGTLYDDPDEAFYWEKRLNSHRKPCIKCISKYNRSPKERARRNEYNRKYFQKKRDEDKAAGRPDRYGVKRRKKNKRSGVNNAKRHV